MLIHGFELAKQIEHDMVRYGRTRKLPKNGSQIGNNSNDHVNNDVIGHIDHDDSNQCNNDATDNNNTNDATSRDASSTVLYNNNQRPTFLYDNNSCCPHSFASHGSEDIGSHGRDQSRSSFYA